MRKPKPMTLAGLLAEAQRLLPEDSIHVEVGAWDYRNEYGTPLEVEWSIWSAHYKENWKGRTAEAALLKLTRWLDDRAEAARVVPVESVEMGALPDATPV